MSVGETAVRQVDSREVSVVALWGAQMDAAKVAEKGSVKGDPMAVKLVTSSVGAMVQTMATLGAELLDHCKAGVMGGEQDDATAGSLVGMTD